MPGRLVEGARDDMVVAREEEEAGVWTWADGVDSMMLVGGTTFFCQA